MTTEKAKDNGEKKQCGQQSAYEAGAAGSPEAWFA